MGQNAHHWLPQKQALKPGKFDRFLIKGKPGYPGVIDQIRGRMKGKMREGGSLRFGFRIYRDSTKGGPSGVEDEGPYFSLLP